MTKGRGGVMIGDDNSNRGRPTGEKRRTRTNPARDGKPPRRPKAAGNPYVEKVSDQSQAEESAPWWLYA